jgi:hypothetical protein
MRRAVSSSIGLKSWLPSTATFALLVSPSLAHFFFSHASAYFSTLSHRAMTSPGEEVRPRPTLPSIRDLFRGAYIIAGSHPYVTDIGSFRRAELAQSSATRSVRIDSASS